MLTPRFHLTQTADALSIHIRAPYCSLGGLEVSADKQSFVFTCRPYHLRLTLPGSLADADALHSEFDSDTGMFAFVYEKSTPGEDFPDLELITKLLCTKVAVNDGSKKIEVLCSEGTDSVKNCVLNYGFAMSGGHNLMSVLSEFGDVFDIDPHQVKLNDRSALRVEMENDSYSLEHCLADLIDNDDINEMVKQKLPQLNNNFTSEELDFLKDLHNTDYDLSDAQQEYCRNSLLDILYAYCYDQRTTFFESTCESGWTINKLSATLCCFDGFLSPKEAVIAAYRRALAYPLFRQISLCDKILEDLKYTVQLDIKYIIRCLIAIHGIFLRGDSGRHVLNNLYIRDYINYVMKWDKDAWQKTVTKLMAVRIKKEDLGLELPEVPQIEQQMGLLKITVLDSDDSTDSDDAVDSSATPDKTRNC